MGRSHLLTHQTSVSHTAGPVGTDSPISTESSRVFIPQTSHKPAASISLMLVVGIVSSTLLHGIALLVPLPSQVTPSPRPTSSPAGVAHLSLNAVPRSRYRAQPISATPKSTPAKPTPATPGKRPLRRQQHRLATPAIATPQALPSPVASPESPQTSPSPALPSPSLVENKPQLFSDFPQADQASLCGTEQGDCWQVPNKRWNQVRDDLQAKLVAKGQELNEVDRDDDPAFRVYRVYENGRPLHFVHVLSLDQMVAYVLYDQELSREEVRARVNMSKATTNPNLQDHSLQG